MKIAIVGNGPLTRGLAPFGTDWEVWGLAFREFEYRTHYGKPRAYTSLWECHEVLHSLDYMEFMKTNNVVWPDKEECRILAGDEGFKSSLAYMMAEAILKKPDEMALYGFDCCIIKKKEYDDQIPNIKYFLGLAIGRGIKVIVPPQSDLFETDYYGEENGHQ